MRRFERADTAFFAVSPYVMDASATFGEALKSPVISLFFSVIIAAKRMQSSYITAAHVGAIS